MSWAADRREAAADLMDWQHNRCGGCLRPFTKRRVPALDHDHRTGKVRGLLCTRCNLLLGQINEDLSLLIGLAEYLTHHPADDALTDTLWWPGSPGAAGMETT